MEDHPVTVLIADDHGVVRQGLRTLLERHGIRVVGEATTGREAITLTDQLLPKVVLLDIRMPDYDGLQALAAIKTSHPEISVVMLTTYANPGYLSQAVVQGAACYLSKEIDPERIPTVVYAVARGEHLLEGNLLQMALAGAAENIVLPETELSPVDPLTERERVVLHLVVEGLSNEAIASVLSISLSTVKTHVRHILDKLAVSDRTQAAVWAVRHGMALPS